MNYKIQSDHIKIQQYAILITPEMHSKNQHRYITSMCLQNLELFEFPRVLAFPNASRMEVELEKFCELIF